MQNNNAMYNEVYEFLNLLGEKYIKKIPVKFYEFIKQEQILNYDLNWDISKDIVSQLSEDAIALIAYLNMSYWCEEEEKIRLEKIYRDNDTQNKKEYNLEKILNEKREKLSSENTEIMIIDTKKENIFKKFIEKIKSIFVKR